jgi:drug/metabolite transporter (DMT)-like permease
LDDNSLTIGCIFALSAAFAWASASIMFRRLGDSVSPLGVNLGKGLVGLVCLSLTLAFVGFEAASPKVWFWLGLSGIFGIAIGDTSYFATLNRLGPRRTLLLTSLIPVVASFLAMILFGERLKPTGWIGAVMTIAGVSWVMWEKLEVKDDAGSWRAGIGYGLLTVVSCSIGIIFSKIGLNEIRPLDATFIRMICGTAGLVIFGLFRKDLGGWLIPFKIKRNMMALLAASFLGSYLGMWFALAALDYANVTLSSILSSTSPIFVLPMAYIFMKEKITIRGVIGALIATAGIALLFAQ